MAGKGIKKVSGFGHGDHYINIKIEPPKTLTDKQSAILRAFAELETNTPGTVMGLTYAVGGRRWSWRTRMEWSRILGMGNAQLEQLKGPLLQGSS